MKSSIEDYQRQIKFIIDSKSRGNSFQEINYTMKLMLKGIPVKEILDGDAHLKDEGLSDKIRSAAKDLNIDLPN